MFHLTSTPSSKKFMSLLRARRSCLPKDTSHSEKIIKRTISKSRSRTNYSNLGKHHQWQADLACFRPTLLSHQLFLSTQLRRNLKAVSLQWLMQFILNETKGCQSLAPMYYNISYLSSIKYL